MARRVTQFAKGYQTAMHEVLDIWDLDGAEAALAYVRANTVQPTCKTCGTPVKRNGRGELIHVDYMSRAHNHAATLEVV